MLRRLAASCLLTVTAIAAPQVPAAGGGSVAGAPDATARFRNGANTFQLDLPAAWRQLAPNEARRIAANPRAPSELCFAQPHLDYCVGPVDRWLAGDFGGPFVHVAESQQEFHVGDDFADALADAWARRSAATGARYALRDVARTAVGTQQVDAIVALRLATPADGRPAIQSLDVHCPAGGSQVTLSFCSPPEQFAGLEPTFRSWLATLTFARTPREPQTLGDRLWPVAITSVVVGVVLWVLWRHTRRGR